MKKTLWTKDFKLLTVSTIISIIGGEAMNFPLSLIVFEKTQSTFLASIFYLSNFLPDFILIMFLAPFVDRANKKRWVVGLDICFFAIYILMAIYVANFGFNYSIFLMFSLFMNTISVMYRLCYSAWYPDIIEPGFEQKGFAVGGTIWPIISMVMAPVSAFLYEKVGLTNILYFVAGTLLVSIFLESQISYKYSSKGKISNVKEYFEDIKEALLFFKKEKGIRNIYTYSGLTNGVSTASQLMTQAYFQTAPGLTVVMLGFIKTAEMIGRSFGGLFQYKVDISPKKRYPFIKFVYFFYQISEGLMLYMPYPIMLAIGAVQGALGSNSANIRQTAVQSYLPKDIRARINALGEVIFSGSMVAFQIIGGVMGEYIPYRIANVILAVFSILAIYFIIVRPQSENRKVYEAVRTEPKELEVQNA